MADTIELKIPDIGDFDEVAVIEVLIQPGDTIAVEQSLVTLESDKATMEVPSDQAGTIREVKVKVGDKVAKGTVLATMEPAADQPPSTAPQDKATQPIRTEQPKGGEMEEEPAPGKPPPVSPQAIPATEDRSESRAEASGDADCDLVVIGAGPGGYTAAFRAADLGLKTILIERYPVLGGVCLNVGCIPSKALLHAAQIIDEAAAFAERGIRFGAPEIDAGALGIWKDGVVKRLTDGLSALARQRKVEVIQGTAAFASATSLDIRLADGDSRTLRFRNCIIAAGSRASAPPGFDMDHPRLMDSTGALNLADIPKRLLVVGGGIIGLEMAAVYDALGSSITVVELQDRLIPGADRDMVRPLQKRIESRYEAIHLKTRVTELRAKENRVQVRFEGENAPAEDHFDRVLVAVGRKPNSDRLNLDAAGVALDQQGHIQVDEHMRSSVSHIYAIGDIVGQPMLAHKASHEGKAAAEHCAGQKSAFDARAIPSVAYTDPEIAWTGLTEEAARQQGIAYDKATFPWSANGRSLTLGRDEGVTKLLFAKGTGRIIGGAITGPNAGDLISEVTLAIEMGCDADDIALTIHPHPTLSETVAMAAETAAGTLTDLYLPRNRR